MKELYIYHHMGLGDHIICNAIIRNYAKENDMIHLFVKPHNHKNVSFMFRDLTNIDYIISDDSIAVWSSNWRQSPENYIKDNNITNLLKIGFEKLDISRYKFDESFYNCIGMDFNKKWDDFYIDRDLDKEIKIFNDLGLKENEYIFINEDPQRGFIFDKDKCRHDLPIINSNLPYDLFDLCHIIENAREVHLMESSLKCLSDHINIKTNDLFYHSYVRNYPSNIQVTSKRKWIVLT